MTLDPATLFERCSNVGRWGPDDGLGTLNLITDAKRLAALSAPRSGRVVSLGFDLPVGAGHGRSGPTPVATLEPSYGAGEVPTDAADTFSVRIHGFDVTHVDAPGHAFFEGRAWGGRSAVDVAGEGGLDFGSIQPIAAAGIVTRGVLLDVAAARGVEYLAQGEGIGVTDLELAEARGGVRVEPGDCVVVRSGHDRRRSLEGDHHDDSAPHEGVLPEVLPWLHDRDVAVYAGDCIERRPSDDERVAMPLHQVGLVAMGLCILDVPDVEALAAACEEEGRTDFLLVIAPLRIPGGTGSAVNPLALF